MRKGWLTAGAVVVLAASSSVAVVDAAPRAPRAAAVVSAAITPNGSWTVYHHDNAHTGYDSAALGAVGATAGWSTTNLDESAYGEPLVYGGLVYVATSNNTVYAINQTSGATVWSRNLGAPQTSGWQCGNIDPTGILGTGVIDASAGRYYVVAFIHSTLSYHLFGLSLTTGATQLNTVVKPSGFDWTIQQERGALALSKDRSHVYVPFGGRAGDCGAYNGWVVGVPTSGAAANEVYKTPSHASGVWAAGGVAIEDSTGNPLFATGNAIPCVQASSDSVIATSPTLTSPTFFQPSDWDANWCQPDEDLGSATPVIISPTLAFSAGKYGQGFLINPASLGGTNGQLFPAKSPYVGADVCAGNHSDATFGSFAYAAPRLYIECDGVGLVSLTVNTSTPSFTLCGATCNSGSWIAGSGRTFGPPIVAGGIVWVVDINGGGLFGYNASTGAQLFHSASFSVTHFTTPSEAGGQIFVATDSGLKSFNMRFGCQSVAAAATPASPHPVGTPITVTATASGCPNPNPSYRFAVLAPGSNTYQLLQGYSTTSTLSWTPTGVVPGTYRFSVWAMDSASTGAFGNSSGRWDAYNNSVTYTLTSCTSVSVGAAPSSPQGVGTGVTLTASASGCPSPLFRFAVLAPGSSTYQQVQAYSSTATYAWDTTGAVPGTYRFSVWTRDSNSLGSSGNASGRWDAYNNNTLFSLSTCTSVSVVVSPPSPSAAGTSVTVTATANGCPNPSPLYRFSILAPGASTYALARAYSTTASYAWDTTGLPAGDYRFSVWAMDADSGGAAGNGAGRWDVYNNTVVYTIG